MGTISKLTDGGPAVLWAHVYLIGVHADLLEFEVLESNASALPKQIGVKNLLSIDGETPFWGTLVSLEPCTSTAPGLALLREKSALKGILRRIAADTQQLQ